MTALALIHRELRVEARRAWNYWLRLLAGVAVTGVFILTSVNLGMIGSTAAGWQLFLSANFLLYGGIWFVAPLLTADCLSREKREGTLGLLFLTPLSARGIVLGKSVVHLWRGTSFVLAAMPVMAVALLMGGVSGTQVLIALIVQMGALSLALSAGLAASAWTRHWIRAVLLAALMAAPLYVFHWWLIEQTLGNRGVIWGATGFSTRLLTQLAVLPALVCAVLLWMVQRRLRSMSADESLSRRQLWWLKTFCRPLPILHRRFKMRSSWKLDRNPIGWLQQYSWSARLTKWGWCAAMIAAETSAVTDWHSFQTQQIFFVLCLALGISFTAAGSFRRERQTGALELILVAPLQVNQIIFGRLKGIWGQFLPAALVLAVSAWFALSLHRPTGSALVFPLLASTYLSAPVIGLYCSLKTTHFLVAWMLTVLVMLSTLTVAPMLAIFFGGFLYFTGLMDQFFRTVPLPEATLFSSAVIQALLAVVFFGWLERDLAKRNFPFDRQIA